MALRSETLDGTLLQYALLAAALWIVIAAVLALIAARRLQRANSLVGQAQSLQRLIAAAPARPVLIYPDRSFEADPSLLAALGFDQPPRMLKDLTGESRGISAGDLGALLADISGAALTGEAFQRQVRTSGTARVYEVRGAPAPPPAAPGSVLLWMFDVSDTEGERLAMAKRLSQTESALDSLTHLIESAPFPMWYRSPDLSLVLVNSAFVAAVEGRDAADVIARGSELIDGSGEASARGGATTALESGKPFARTHPATIGGERRMLKFVDVPLASGAVAGFAIDIQDLEDARIELAQHIQSQRDLADRMTAGAAQFDADRRLSFFNQPFASMAMLDPEWLADQPEFDRVLDQMREQNRLPEVRDYPAWKEERRAWFISPEEMLEEDWILANGDHLRIVAQPLPDGGLRWILEDRTEQVRLASARDTLLRVRAATFDNLFESVSVFASDGRLYLWNRRFSQTWELDEEWLGEHPRVDELVPAMARKLTNPTAAAQVRELVRSTTSGRQSGTGRVSMTDGRHFEFAAVPLPDGNALFTMVDVTDSTRIESALRERATALEQADRIKTDFVANMSYELRTPLTSIGGFAEMLAKGYAGKLAPAAGDYVNAILESVERLSRLIDNVLDLTQGDTQGVTIERERVDIAGLCRTAIATLEPRAQARKQTIKPSIAPQVGIVVGDARRLRESIEHVLANAIAYSPERKTIDFEADGDDDEVTITVRDRGPGIPEHAQDDVFSRFHRVEGAAKGEAALGLGLPLTRQFVEAHGGRVVLDSAIDKGTTVTLHIPRAPQ